MNFINQYSRNMKFVFLIIGVVGSYINQLGDLIASSLKRKVGLKDYSNIFPGHGGFMDRMDGLCCVALVLAIAIEVIV